MEKCPDLAKPFPGRVKAIARAAEVDRDEAATIAEVIRATYAGINDLTYDQLSVLARMGRDVLRRNPQIRPYYEARR